MFTALKKQMPLSNKLNQLVQAGNKRNFATKSGVKMQGTSRPLMQSVFSQKSFVRGVTLAAGLTTFAYIQHSKNNQMLA